MGDKLADGVALEDVLDIYNSRISSPEVRGNVCFECLAVPAIFNACWLEEGMISKNLARKAGSNSVEFDEARGHSSSSSSKTLSEECVSTYHFWASTSQFSVRRVIWPMNSFLGKLSE